MQHFLRHPNVESCAKLVSQYATTAGIPDLSESEMEELVDLLLVEASRPGISLPEQEPWLILLKVVLRATFPSASLQQSHTLLLLAASGNHHSPSLPALAALTNMVVNNPCLHLPLAERLLPYLGENFTAIFPLPCDDEGGKKDQTEPTAAVILLCTARMLIHCATSLYLHCTEKDKEKEKDPCVLFRSNDIAICNGLYRTFSSLASPSTRDARRECWRALYAWYSLGCVCDDDDDDDDDDEDKELLLCHQWPSQQLARLTPLMLTLPSDDLGEALCSWTLLQGKVKDKEQEFHLLDEEIGLSLGRKAMSLLTPQEMEDVRPVALLQTLCYCSEVCETLRSDLWQLCQSTAWHSMLSTHLLAQSPWHPQIILAWQRLLWIACGENSDRLVETFSWPSMAGLLVNNGVFHLGGDA
jgi:hypothetical protein